MNLHAELVEEDKFGFIQTQSGTLAAKETENLGSKWKDSTLVKPEMFIHSV